MEIKYAEFRIERSRIVQNCMVLHVTLVARGRKYITAGISPIMFSFLFIYEQL